MFIPERKLRRKLNKKDKERRNSYVEISNNVKKLQKEYAGDDAAFLYPSSQQTTHVSQVTPTGTHNDNSQNVTTLVFEGKLYIENYILILAHKI